MEKKGPREKLIVNFSHTPIMLAEILGFLNVKQNKVFVDCTLGGAGHSFAILQKLNNTGGLIGIDKDEEALDFSREKLKNFTNVIFVHDDFKNIEEIFHNLQVEKIDGCLIDLGVSSYQLDTAERGFSFRFDAPLDMRMNKEQEFSAFHVVNNYSYEKLVKILFEYGEEPFAKQIAKNIIKHRLIKPIETTFELKEIIEKSMPAKIVFKSGGASKKAFQAIRIEVNTELDKLYETLKTIVEHLNSGARLCVLSFHSLEDRIVKNAMIEMSKDCICPPNMPICTCHHKASVKILTKKPIESSIEEKESNNRSTCAKLRVCEKL